MRILWISNILLGRELKSTGTWLNSMADELTSNNEITLLNAVPVNRAFEVEKKDNLIQLPLPQIKRSNATTLSGKEQKIIAEIIEDFKPDIIHVWGLENGWGLLKKYVDIPVLIEVQGVKSEISKYMYGMLSRSERLRSISFKEVVRVRTLFFRKKIMRSCEEKDNEIVRINKYFGTPTEWMKGNVIMRNSEAVCYRSQLLVRKEFKVAKKWSSPSNDSVVLTSGSNSEPFKGIHIAIKAIAILKKHIPNVQLRIIGGSYQNKGIRTTGYYLYLKHLVKVLNLEGNVVFLGALNASEIVDQMYKSNIFVVPSFIESASLTLLEAMEMEIPIITTYTGGIPTLGGNSVTYYGIGDYYMLSYLLLKKLTNKEEPIRSKNTLNSLSYSQIEIYKDVIQKHL